jgi:hypothetical protein
VIVIETGTGTGALIPSAGITGAEAEAVAGHGVGSDRLTDGLEPMINNTGRARHYRSAVRVRLMQNQTEVIGGRRLKLPITSVVIGSG